MLVRDSNLEHSTRNACQHIKFREVERRVTIDPSSVLYNHKVEPSTPSSAACACSDLVSHLLQVLSNLVVVLCLASVGRLVIKRRRLDVDTLCQERPLPHASGIRLDHPNNLSNVRMVDPQTRQAASYRARRRSHERICSIIDVEHRGVCPLNQDLLAGGESLVHVANAVDHKGPEALRKLLVPLHFKVKVNLSGRGALVGGVTEFLGKPLLLAREVCSHLGLKIVPVVKVTHTEPCTVRLAAQRWADTALGGPNGTLSKSGLAHTVLPLMVVEHDVCPV
mmetsp:Transcript_34149/g.80076  ORF Transcript_34149/g.80076 Transcript_34149/m.80076 type:complete len:280 (+) Transcript_34149:459-1298(+)